MGWFEDKKNVEEYIRMSEGYNGREVIDVLREFLPEHATLLELGMGPGRDLDILRKYYKVTGSDSSQVFLDIYSAAHPDTDLILLDAEKLNTERVFQGIYSNKVLIHLSREQLKTSFLNQLKILKEDGYALHTFWMGEGEEVYNGLKFIYHTPESIKELLPEGFMLLSLTEYTEEEEGDSLCLILKKRSDFAESS